MAADILFKEGAMHNVAINIPAGIILTGYKAKIQVRKSVTTDEVEFEFKTDDNTIKIAEQQILLTIPANLTVNKNGNYQWQLMLYTSEVDAIKFPIYKFVILPAITK